MNRPIQILKPDHIVLNVQNMEAALHFYTEVLGLSVERLEEYQKGEVGFPSVRMGEQLIDLFPTKISKITQFSADNQQRVNHFCLRIASGAALAEIETYLQENGITIESRSEHNWGAWGYGSSLYFRDPDGNVVELKQYQD